MPPGQPCAQACFLLWLWFPCLESCSLWSVLQWQWDDLSRSLTILLVHGVTWPKKEENICSLSCTQSSTLCPLRRLQHVRLCSRCCQISYLDALTYAVPRAWDIVFLFLGRDKGIADNFNLFLKIWTKSVPSFVWFSLYQIAPRAQLCHDSHHNATVFFCLFLRHLSYLKR